MNEISEKLQSLRIGFLGASPALNRVFGSPSFLA
jgi:hypothetical protein